MAIDKTKYKDIQFYSQFPYIREIAKGVITSTDNGFGGQEVNTTRAMPAGVTQFPPYVRAYVEYPTNTFAPVQGTDGLRVAWTNTTIYFEGFYNFSPFDAVFKIHYFVYDRLEL